VSDLLDAAPDYAERGWPVVPLHTIANGRCTCGKPDCGTPGKHPRTEHGSKDGSTDSGVIIGWWERWPDANVGLCTGAASGVDVLDVDPRSGGDEALRDLMGEHGSLPDGPVALTGGGGEHRYFRHADGSKNITIASGLEYKTTGYLAVLPPSAHASGQRYDWDATSGPDEPLPDALSWLLGPSRNGHKPVLDG
jgi:hypothetical protein